MVALSWLVATASAASVAVVDFEAWGVTHDDADLATEGVRSALLAAGKLDSLAGSDISDGVSAEAEGELRSARSHAAEARRLYLSGDYDGAVASASQAVDEHLAAHSNVGRRAELADAWYILGVANLQRQQRLDASEAFLHVGALYPHYLEERATNVPAAARPLLAAAQRESERKELLPSEVAEVRELLHVDWVVTGAVTEEGEIVARLWGADAPGLVRPYAELKGYFLPVPVPEVSEVYARLAAEIGKRAVAPTSASAAEEPMDEGDGEPRRQPLLRQWWFWAGTGAVVGGGALVGYALWEPAPVEVPGDPTWSVSVDGLP